MPSEPRLARHRVMRFAQGLGYDGFTAVPSALREELTQRSKGPLRAPGVLLASPYNAFNDADGTPPPATAT